jgi:hypothetical protein
VSSGLYEKMRREREKIYSVTNPKPQPAVPRKSSQIQREGCKAFAS